VEPVGRRFFIRERTGLGVDHCILAAGSAADCWAGDTAAVMFTPEW